jgi:predicted ATP-dependent endonuclease of OLD family
MIASIYIKNFRSIKELEIFPENLCTLLGANSAGKTNILKAIDLVLGEGWTTKARVARELFNDPNQPVEIAIKFVRPIKYEFSNGTEVEADGVELTMKLHPLSCDVRSTPNGRYLSDDFKKKCHFIYIPSQRDLADQMRVSSWTLLGKMMKEIHQNYVAAYENDEEKLKAELKETIKPAKDFIEADFSATETTFKKFSDTFKKYCDLNSVGLANKFEPELNIYNLKWFYKTLQIQVTENDDQVFDAEDLGSGMQNLILISIFQTYAELMGGRVIFGIEEPEIYLYPQAQRALFESFQELSNTSQIFYTTHNPNFVSAVRAHEIEIIQKDDDKGTYASEKDTRITQDFLKDTQFKIYSHFNPYRNEIFFAKKILLVEGPSDKILWETLATEKWGIDINKAGISIIDCTGKGGVIYFTGVANLLGLNYFSIWDEDGESQHSLLKDAVTNERGLELVPNLEEYLHKCYPLVSLSGESDKKIEQAFKWATSTTEWPGTFEAVKEFLS